MCFFSAREKLKESPQISSTVFSGIVCFMNNKTPHYLTSLTEEERHNLTEQAVTEKKEDIRQYQEMKHTMKEQMTALIEERRQKASIQAEKKRRLGYQIERIWWAVENIR